MPEAHINQHRYSSQTFSHFTEGNIEKIVLCKKGTICGQVQNTRILIKVRIKKSELTFNRKPFLITSNTEQKHIFSFSTYDTRSRIPVLFSQNNCDLFCIDMKDAHSFSEKNFKLIAFLKGQKVSSIYSLCSYSGSQEAGASPSMHWVRARVHTETGCQSVPPVRHSFAF